MLGHILRMTDCPARHAIQWVPINGRRPKYTLKRDLYRKNEGYPNEDHPDRRVSYSTEASELARA